MRKIVLRFVILVVLLVSASYLYTLSPRVNLDTLGNECLQKPEGGACFFKAAREIVRKKGVPEALHYAHEVVAQQVSLGLSHAVMHVIGQEAYLLHRSLEMALSYIPAASRSIEHFAEYEGYEHGVAQAFFSVNKSQKAVADLAREYCSKYYGPLPSPKTIPWLEARQCFHALGHALMFVNENDLSASLSHCEALPQEWMEQRCRYGVFMEQTYSYSSLYSSVMGGPPVSGSQISMAELCENLEGRYLALCSSFVGRAYLEGHPRQFPGAFEDCRRVNKEYQYDCLFEFAWIFLPLVRSDFQKMMELCRLAGEYEAVCIDGVAYGISTGRGGRENKGRPFCDFVEEKFRPSCESHSQGDVGGEIIFSCEATGNPSSRSRCYQDKIFAIAEDRGIRRALEALRATIGTFPELLLDCHFVAHGLGFMAPSQFKDITEAILAGHDISVCLDGYLHGVFIEYLRKDDKHGEDINTFAAKACDSFKGFDNGEALEWNCFHGLGHGLMAMSDYRLERALTYCDLASANKFFQESCQRGVFMEDTFNQRVGDPEKSVLHTFGSRTLPLAELCEYLPKSYQASCYFRIIPERIYDRPSVPGGDKVPNVQEEWEICRRTPPEFQPYCFEGIGYVLFLSATNDLMRVKDGCLEGSSSEERRFCFRGAVLRYLLISKKDALDFCNILPHEYLSSCRAMIMSPANPA